MYFIHSLPARAIDYPGSRGLLDYLQSLIKLIILFTYLPYDYYYVFSIESSGEDIIVFQSKPVHDIIPDFFGCCCSECHYREFLSFFKLLQEIPYLHVAWPEIMSPLAYTMCFINCHKSNLTIIDYPQKSLRIKTFRSYI
jgi:hypothetical protein